VTVETTFPVVAVTTVVVDVSELAVVRVAK
jgi:hypothetical protein